jgi:hypothetical protein
VWFWMRAMPSAYWCDEILRPEFLSAFSSNKKSILQRSSFSFAMAWFGWPWTTERGSHGRGPRFDPLCAHHSKALQNEGVLNSETFVFSTTSAEIHAFSHLKA